MFCIVELQFYPWEEQEQQEYCRGKSLQIDEENGKTIDLLALAIPDIMCYSYEWLCQTSFFDVPLSDLGDETGYFVNELVVG